jgi:shikimate dehydrogenase
MHNAVIRAAGRDAVYLPLAAADVEDFVTFARAFDVRGASVTIPFKVAMFSHVLDVDDLTRRVGALNTLRMNGVWSGTNTDVDGFLAPLRARGVPLTGTRASVLGAGGAARAVALALTDAGASVRVHARDMTKARHVAEAASAAIGPWPPEPRSWDLLVNATPIGMTPNIDVSPVPHDSLTGTLVYDLVYNPPVTALLRDADRAGCTTIGGLEMLVAQAEAQVRFWTGSLPEAGVMRAAAAERLAGGVA